MAEVKEKRGIFKYFKEIKSETKKVTWPSKDQLLRQTLVVLVFVILIGAFIFLLDLLFGKLFSTLIAR